MFKVQGSKFKVGIKNEGLLPLTAHFLPLTNTVHRSPFTIYDLNDFNDFNGFNPPVSPERSRWRADALNYLTNLPDNIS